MKNTQSFLILRIMFIGASLRQHSDLLSREVDTVSLVAIRHHHMLLLQVHNSSQGDLLTLWFSTSTSRNVSQRDTVKNKDCDKAVHYTILK